jgi:hypothetical protein
MSNETVYPRRNQSVFSCRSHSSVSWGDGSCEIKQYGFFGAGELCTSAWEDYFGKKKVFEPTGVTGKIVWGYVLISYDADLWRELPHERKTGEERFKPIPNLRQAKFWDV